jgi:competence protein ComEC
MLDMAPVINLDSDVIVAPHHGADNGSSAEFIEAVSPEFVIFSAGSDHEHPRASTAQRYLDAGVLLADIYRTDLGDDEGGDEWDNGRIAHNRDRSGDDDVDVLLHSDGSIEVAYSD